MQGLLFAVVCATLCLKWSREVPRRKPKIFLLDSSKQIVGAGAIHVANMACAMLFATWEPAQVADECAWYWLNIVVDTTFGVLVCYLLLKMTERLIGYDTGHYGKKTETGIDWENDPDYCKWFSQIVVWCFIVMTMKFVVVAIFLSFPSSCVALSTAATHWIKDRQLRLVFVMIITPTFMNMFQFIVTDSFLKHQKTNTV
mmetsp:Transcript_123255/g.241803  ORF Transcript_123255/g.241803 Transcript_123255/m.241803 type:complete len:200 (+) Transcript_123255:3-602(+)